MSYWQATEPLLINHKISTEILSGDVVIIDGGSRNELFPPANKITKNAVVYAFDPSPEPNEYSVSIPVRHIPFALWSQTGTVQLNVANRVGTSSVYPPDYEKLRKFNSRVGWEARRTVEQITVPSKSIDDAVNEGLCASPDLIKLDIHSAEYEALLGAELALENASIVLVETWHHPIHRGQHLHGELETYLNKKGFFLSDIKKASSWRPIYKGRELAGRAVTVGTESVFLRGTSPDLVKQLIMLDMFGFYALALEAAAQLQREERLSNSQFKLIEDLILHKSKSEERSLKRFFSRVFNRVVPN